MKRYLYTLALVALLMQSCSVMKDINKSCYVPGYHLTLTSVDSPANAKERYGETITTEKSNGDSLRYSFEDDYIKISWYAGDDKFYFSLFNKSNHSLKIIWDDATLVRPDNSISKLIHSGINYEKRNDAQVSTTIPRGAKTTDILIPIDNIKYNNYIGWYIEPILPQNIKISDAEEYNGKTLKILLPIKIEDIQNEYTFLFKIETFPKEEFYTEKVHDVKSEIILNTFAWGVIPAFASLLLYYIYKDTIITSL